MQNVRIIEIPDQKMVSSQPGMFGDGRLEIFMLWMDRQKKGIWPKDFLAEEKGEDGAKMRWLHLYEEGMDVPEEMEMYDFKGGLYAVATDMDMNTDLGAMRAAVEEFLNENGMEMDESRLRLGNVITPAKAMQALGGCQMDYYFPVRLAAE